MELVKSNRFAILDQQKNLDDEDSHAHDSLHNAVSEMASGRAGRLQQANAESQNVRDTIVAAGCRCGTAVEVL